jgi:hypothetical protein
MRELSRFCLGLTSVLTCMLLLTQGGQAEKQTPSDADASTLTQKVGDNIDSCGLTSDICRLLDAREYQKAFDACSEFLAKSPEMFVDVRTSYVLKATAYRTRAYLRSQLGESDKASILDEISAAELGDPRAAGHLTEIFVKAYFGIRPIPGMEILKSDLERHARMGAELGDRSSIAVLATADFGLSNDEKTYWTLVSIMLGNFAGKNENRDVAGRSKLVSEMISNFGTQNVARSLNTFSVSGGVLEAQPSGLPGRDIVATIYNEAELRVQYSIAQNWSRGKPRKKTRTSRDFLKAITEMSENDAVSFTKFVILPEGSSAGLKNELSANRAFILANLQPNDMVVVRCGILTHIATIFRIEKIENRVLFSDPLWEFWQPSHNSCVNSFELVKGSYNRFLASVSLEDVGSMIEAVVTVRNRSGDDLTSGITK